jgi:hypothetical protein
MHKSNAARMKCVIDFYCSDIRKELDEKIALVKQSKTINNNHVILIAFTLP